MKKENQIRQGFAHKIVFLSEALPKQFTFDNFTIVLAHRMVKLWHLSYELIIDSLHECCKSYQLVYSLERTRQSRANQAEAAARTGLPNLNDIDEDSHLRVLYRLSALIFTLCNSPSVVFFL